MLEHFFPCSFQSGTAILMGVSCYTVLTLFAPPVPFRLALVTGQTLSTSTSLTASFVLCLVTQSYSHELQPARLHGIFQARILEWVAIPKGSSRLRDQTCLSCVSCIQADSLLLSHQGSPRYNVIQQIKRGHQWHPRGQGPREGELRPLQSIAFLLLALMTCLILHIERINLEQMKLIGWHKKRVI